jgi:hypothetical protein
LSALVKLNSRKYELALARVEHAPISSDATFHVHAMSCLGSRGRDSFLKQRRAEDGMKKRGISIATFLIASVAPALAQSQTVDRTANGSPGTDIRVGVYINVKPDCTSGPLPSIQLISAPENGKVTVKQGKVTATNYKQCLAIEVPDFIAFYRSRPDFMGVDVLTLEVKFPGGRTELQRISITVGTGSPGRGT